jgi:serine/threonine protein kinase
MSADKGTGSARYLAPENMVDLKTKNYALKHELTDSAKGDVWSLGVILINLLFGKNPWHEAHPTDPIYNAFCYTDPDILQSIFHLTPRMNSLVKRIFDFNPRTRISLDDLIIEFEEISHYTQKQYSVIKHADSARTIRCDSSSEDPYDPPLFADRKSDSLKPHNIIKHVLDAISVNPIPSPITPKECLDCGFKLNEETTDAVFGIQTMRISDNMDGMFDTCF